MNISKYNPEGYMDLTPYYALKEIGRNARKTACMPLVFICSPFKGDVQSNIKKARRYCRFAMRQNMIPFAPHLLFPQFMDDSHDYERQRGIEMGLVLLNKCSELWWFGNKITQGMAVELDRARHRKIKIRHYTDDCVEVE